MTAIPTGHGFSAKRSTTFYTARGFRITRRNSSNRFCFIRRATGFRSIPRTRSGLAHSISRKSITPDSCGSLSPSSGTECRTRRQSRMTRAIQMPYAAQSQPPTRRSIFARSCDFEGQHLDQASRIFNFGTTFWHIDWVEDGDKYGWKDEPQFETQDVALGNAGFQCKTCGGFAPSDGQPPSAPPNCPGCGTGMSSNDFQSPQTVPQPVQTGTKKVPNGALEVKLRDCTEVWVPLDATCIDDCDWLRWEREEPKGRVLRRCKERYPGFKEEDLGAKGGFSNNATALGEMIRSAMSSPLGLVRMNRANRWTCEDVWWNPNQYELVKNQEAQQALKENFPDGVRLIYVKGKLMEMCSEKLSDHWQECKPEPHCRIMTQALGDEWADTTDVTNNTTNMMEENVMRSNLPLFANSQKIDTDAFQNRRTKPGEIFPMLPRAGRALSDELYQPQPVQFSEQVPSFQSLVIDFAKNNTGLNDAIWGGGEPDPTARQTLLKTNQALMQLGLFWTQIRKCLEQVLMKSCKLMGEYTEGITKWRKKNQFGRYDSIVFAAEDLKSDSYHFEADEAIPINWGQQRDQLMWLLGQAHDNPEMLKTLGVNDPMNVFEIKQLLGIPGLHTNNFDAREKGMDVIAQLIADGKAVQPPGAPNPDGSPGQPGPKQSSVQPDWEDPHQFMSDLVTDFLLANADLKKSNPDAYENVQLYGQAQFGMANPPPQLPPPKETVAVSFKGSDIGPQATQAILEKGGMLPDGVNIQPAPDPKLIDAQAKANESAAIAPPAPVNGAPANLMPPPLPTGGIPQGPVQ